MDAAATLALLDWKRQVAAIYADVRAAADPAAAWKRWRSERDRLFATHRQSPLTPAARERFAGLCLYDHDPAARVLAAMRPTDERRFEIAGSTAATFAFTRFAVAAFELGDDALELELYWLEAYGGGLFVPFGDSTSADETYGAGRYVLDTVKGADLGSVDGRLVLDFNFAYQPSCSYNPAWSCPLAPPANRLAVPVRAGERLS